MRYFIFTVVVLAFLNGCNNPFATREPEIPDSQGATIRPPTSPENILQNLISSIEHLSIQDYLDVYSDNFIFNPDPGDSLEFIEEYTNGWTIEEETVFAQNFLQRSVVKDLNFNMDIIPEGTNIFFCNYLFIIVPVEGVTFDVKGTARIHLEPDDFGKWQIIQWTETKTEGGKYLTFSGLKAINI